MKDLTHLPQGFISWKESVERVGDDEEFLIELLNDLKTLVKESLPNLIELARNSNFPEIRAIAHSIKGASGNLGLNMIYQTTLNLEDKANKSNSDEVNQLIEDLVLEFEHLKTLVE